MRAYTMREMKSILQYLIEHEAYSQTKGRKLWMNLADSSVTDRSWQSLKENFHKRILPDIHNPYYGLSTEQIRSFRQGRDLTTKDLPLSEELPLNENVKADGANLREIAENMEAVNDAGEEDAQSTSSHSSSSTARLVIDESSNQEGTESDECSESIGSKKSTITQPVVEVSDNVTERVSPTQNGRVSPINSDVMPIRKNYSYESQINESLPVNSRDKSPVEDHRFNIGPSCEQETNKDSDLSTNKVQSKSMLTSDSHFPNDRHKSLKGFNNDEIEKVIQEPKKRTSLAYLNRKSSVSKNNVQSKSVFTSDSHFPNDPNKSLKVFNNDEIEKVIQEPKKRTSLTYSNQRNSVSTNNVQSKSVLTSDSHFPNDPNKSLKGFNNDEIEKVIQEPKKRTSLTYSNRRNSVSTNNVQSKGVLTSDSHFPNDQNKSLKGFNNDEIEKVIQEPKKRTSLAYSNRRNSMTVQGNYQKSNISENRDYHVRTIIDSSDNENLRINGNPTCSKYMQPSLGSYLEDQSDKQTNSDPNRERATVPNKKVTKVVVLNSQSDSNSDDLIEINEQIKRKRSTPMPQSERKALQKISHMPLANLDAKSPQVRCNCSKTCALSKNNTANWESDETTIFINNRRQSDKNQTMGDNEMSSSDGEIPVEPYKSTEEEEKNWMQRFIIDQEKKTNVIMQTLEKMQNKIDCQETAFVGFRKQLAVDKNFAFIDYSSNQENENSSRNEGYEDKENPVKIHILTKSQDIRLKGDWKDICFDFNELLKVLKLTSPNKSNNTAATATVEELQDNELQSQAVAKKVPAKRGRKPSNMKGSVSSKAKSPQGKSKSRKNVKKDGTKETLKKPVRKSPRISKMRMKTFTEDNDDNEQSDDSLKLPESISSPAMSFIQSLNPNDYQDSTMSSSKTNRKKRKYSLCEERRTQSHFVKSLLNESPNINFANFTEQIREPKIMPEICDNIMFTQSQTSLTNTSSITLPPTPEISSIRNMNPMNGSTYTLYDTDVSMALLNQDVKVFKESTLYQPKDYLPPNDTSLKLKTKASPNADITETQSLFALFRPLKEKMKSLFPGRDKETKPRRLTDSSVAGLNENKSMFHGNVMKAKKSKNRTSTPLKRNKTRKSKSTVIEPIIDERFEFRPHNSQNESSVHLLQEKDMSNYNILDGQYKKKKTKPFGNERKKFISKSSKASLCGSSDMESSLLQDSIELIHNHSETCLFANEQKRVPPPRSLSAITTSLKSTITSFEKEKTIDKTIFDPDLLNSDANDCYSSNLNNTFSGISAASNDVTSVTYNGSMLDDVSREISPQPRLRASKCNLLAKYQSTDSSLFP